MYFASFAYNRMQWKGEIPEVIPIRGYPPGCYWSRVDFDEGGKPAYSEKNPRSQMRSTETQPTYDLEARVESGSQRWEAWFHANSVSLTANDEVLFRNNLNSLKPFCRNLLTFELSAHSTILLSTQCALWHHDPVFSKQKDSCVFWFTKL